MNRIIAILLLAVGFLLVSQRQATAQQLGGGGPGDASRAGDAGSTTEGLGGLTTDGTGGGGEGAAEGGFAGANAAGGFVGAGNAEGFVGGARESETNSNINRLFRSIQAGEVPTGSTQESTGNPRRIPVSLRLGFAAPPARSAAVMAGTGGTSFERFLSARPGLRSVQVTLADSGVATLTGVAPDAETWRLAANLIRLQPGVRRIDNQIQVVMPLQQGRTPAGAGLPR